MLIPIGHENMTARRWPVVTLGLIAVNLVALLLTMSTVQQEAPELEIVRQHILRLVILHPELTQPPEAQQLVANIEQSNPKRWQYAKEQTYNLPVLDEWDAGIRMRRNSDGLQEEMDALCTQYAALAKADVSQKYAFVPAHPTAISYVTANFLHGGWLHLIGNMWFLWLTGLVLEDKWGRAIYTIFYFAAGAVALQVHAWATPGSLVPTLGASGAVAGLMGAFLVRFPTMKIKILWWRFVRVYRFDVQAFWLLPLWLLMEIFYGSLSGSHDGVAHWAHVGGFGFGVVAALLLRLTGLEHKADQAIEAKLNQNALTNDAAIVEATGLMEHGQLDEALAVLKNFLAANPGSMDAWRLQQQIHWRKSEIPAYQEATIKLCSLHARAKEYELALQEYQEFMNSGGTQMPAATWLELGRAAENVQAYDRAVDEYKKLAAAWPTERQSVLAQIAAGKLCARKLNRPQDALTFYDAAASSKVPHLDLDVNIEAGMREARAALAPKPMAVAAGVNPVG